MPSLIFPVQLFNPRVRRVWLSAQVIESGPALNGEIDVIRTDGGGIRNAEYGGIVLNTDDKIRAWEAWSAEFEGGANSVTVPLLTNKWAPRPIQGSAPVPYGQLAPGSTDEYFPETAGYGLEMVTAVIASPASLRAVLVDIELQQGGVIKGGETFSIAHTNKGNRAYVIRRVLARVGDVYTVLIDCPLREVLAGGEKANFDWPLCDMRKTPESDISALMEYNRSEVSITFREAF